MKLLSLFVHLNPKEEKIPIFYQLALFFILIYAGYITRSPIDIYYGYIFYLLLFPGLISKFGIPKTIGIPFFILGLVGLYYSFTGENSFINFFKVYIGTFASYLFFYFIVIKKAFNIHSIFKVYLKFSLFACILGVLQIIAFNLGLDNGKGLFWLFGAVGKYPGGIFGFRLSTFFGEPTYFAMFCSGALFVAIHDIIYRNNRYYFKPLGSLLVIIALYSSFSGTIIGTIAIIFFLLGLNYGIFRYALIASPIVIFLLVRVIQSSDDFEKRYDGTLNLFLDAPQESFNVYKYHGSSVILYDHFRVAFLNFLDHPLFGSGIGSHPNAYDNYSLIKNHVIFKYQPNKQDASSMFNRLLSETGLFGIGIFFVLIFYGFTRRKIYDKQNFLWIISGACFTVILINMARQGNYFLNGFPFYVWMYYAAWKENQKTKEEQVLAGE